MTANEPLPTPTPGQTLTLWAAQLLLAVFFAFAGVHKLFGLQQELLDQFARMGPCPWLRYLVGALELVGAIVLMVPQLAAGAALVAAVVGVLVVLARRAQRRSNHPPLGLA